MEKSIYGNTVAMRDIDAARKLLRKSLEHYEKKEVFVDDDIPNAILTARELQKSHTEEVKLKIASKAASTEAAMRNASIEAMRNMQELLRNGSVITSSDVEKTLPITQESNIATVGAMSTDSKNIKSIAEYEKEWEGEDVESE